MTNWKRVFFVLALIFASSLASAADFTHVVSNSENWKDVFSTIHYASLSGASSDFLVSTKHGQILLSDLNKGLDLRIITSKKTPYVLGYLDLIKSKGFEGSDEISVDNANLELINQLADITNFVVVDGRFGYDAMAVVPYAVKSKAWIFFADSSTIDEIDSILSNRKVDSVLIYGYLDKPVRDALQKYNPTIINNGERFKDNVEIVEKYRKLSPINQVLLTNGEFIEKELMSGNEPTLFTGKDNVTDSISTYLKKGDFSVGVLIGSDLVGAATNIRRGTGISVIVKFARSARNPSSSISSVEGLDLFYLPMPLLALDIYSAKYNKATSQLEVTYNSTSNVPEFFKGTITMKTETGENKVIGDLEPIFIAPGEFKTMIYSDFKAPSTGSFNISIYTLYGLSPSSLEKVLERSLSVDLIDVLDSCDIQILGVSYSKANSKFYVKIKNIGKTQCYADAELENILIDGKKTTIGSNGAVKIDSGKTKYVSLTQSMTDEDLAANPEVDVKAYYGERENSLVKVMKGRFKLTLEGISGITIAIIAVIALILIFIILFFWRRRKDEDF